MNELERWIYLDGPVPENVRPLLDALREMPPPTPEDRARRSRRFFETLDARLAQQEAQAGGGEGEGEGQRERGGDGDGVAAGPVTRVAQQVGEEGATVRSPEPVAPEELQARGKLRVQVLLPREENEREPAVAPMPENLAATADASFSIPVDWRDALPFKPEVPGQQKAARTLHAALMPAKGQGETLDLDDVDFAKARDAARADVARGVLPFVGSAAAAPPPPVVSVSFPPLTVIQYASFCAELSVWPERVGQILSKYQVPDEAARQALDAHWRRQLAEQAEVRVVFEQKLVEFTRYVRALGR